MSGRRVYINIRNKLCKVLNPALCLTCGIPISATSYICRHCFDALEPVTNPCSHCGLPNKLNETICPSCRHRPPRWHSMIAPLIYTTNTRKIIHDLKFNEQLHLAHALLTHILAYYRNHPVDVLLPVPLHKSRLLERGYNQSEEIASILSRFLNIPVDRKSLQRIKATESQSGLSYNKRQKNIRKAFRYNALKKYNSVAIIDDIVTTGSTVTEVCKILQKSGIKHIEVWSLARALKHD